MLGQILTFVCTIFNVILCSLGSSKTLLNLFILMKSVLFKFSNVQVQHFFYLAAGTFRIGLKVSLIKVCWGYQIFFQSIRCTNAHTRSGNLYCWKIKPTSKCQKLFLKWPLEAGFKSNSILTDPREKMPNFTA